MKRSLVLAGIVVLAGCAGPASQSTATATPAQSVHASSSPRPAGSSTAAVTLVVADSNGTVHFLTESGAESGHLALGTDTRVLGTGGQRIFVSTAGTALKALRQDGSGVTLDTSTAQGFGALVTVTRDGTRWAWATGTLVGNGFQTTVKVASEGKATRVVLSRTEGKGILQPFAWTPSGIYINPLPMDANGYFPFNGPVIVGVMELLNPTTGQTTPVGGMGDCAFSDGSDAGVIACYLGGPKPTLRLVYSPGNVLDLTLATPRFNNLGDAYFSRDSTLLTVAGATGVGMPAELSGGVQSKPEVYGVDLVRVRDGSIWKFGPVGVRVAMGEQSWLPDGKLVLWRPPEAAGGPPGLYVTDPFGSGPSTFIPTTAQPIGYLTSAGAGT